jgi:hypothetical protein
MLAYDEQCYDCLPLADLCKTSREKVSSCKIQKQVLSLDASVKTVKQVPCREI